MSRDDAREWTIREVTAEDTIGINAVRELFAEYGEWLGEAVCSQTLPAEIARLPGPYAAPAGALLLAVGVAGEPLGAVGLRPHDERASEMKRLYVRPHARGTGLGKALSEAAVERARAFGYEEVRLTTLPESMGAALAMYAAMGFEPCDPFVDHSHVQRGVEMTYMRLRLR